jgi:hypothetical protein
VQGKESGASHVRVRFQEQRKLHAFNEYVGLRFLLERQLLQLSLIQVEKDRNQ